MQKNKNHYALSEITSPRCLFSTPSTNMESLMGWKMPRPENTSSQIWKVVRAFQVQISFLSRKRIILTFLRIPAVFGQKLPPSDPNSVIKWGVLQCR